MLPFRLGHGQPIKQNELTSALRAVAQYDPAFLFSC
jgi:hypothetical protein